jgi:ribosomal protein S5
MFLKLIAKAVEDAKKNLVKIPLMVNLFLNNKR